MSGGETATLEDLETILGAGRPFTAFSLICSPALTGVECLLS